MPSAAVENDVELPGEKTFTLAQADDVLGVDCYL
jgi:hypothetical protein